MATRKKVATGLFAVLFLAGCGTPAEPPVSVQTRQAEETVSSIDGADITDSTDEPEGLVPSREVGGEDDATVQLPHDSDPENGAALFVQFHGAAGASCSACHRVDSDERLIGPGLLNIANRAGARVADQSAVEYIYTSIVEPSAYIVPEYPDIMPKSWAQALTEEQIYDVIAYLMSLNQP